MTKTVNRDLWEKSHNVNAMVAHRTFDDDDPTRTIAMVHPASRKSVEHVMAQEVDTTNGRSGWVWLRLPNGDLILGVFPQGDTYCDVEDDACFRD